MGTCLFIGKIKLSYTVVVRLIPSPGTNVGLRGWCLDFEWKDRWVKVGHFRNCKRSRVGGDLVPWGSHKLDVIKCS